MISHCDGKVPEYAWDIFLAFDEGEVDRRGDAFTRERVITVQRTYGVA
jgi:hypothetical protein